MQKNLDKLKAEIKNKLARAYEERQYISAEAGGNTLTPPTDVDTFNPYGDTSDFIYDYGYMTKEESEYRQRAAETQRTQNIDKIIELCRGSIDIQRQLEAVYRII